MRSYGFLLSRRWILFALFVVALAAVCVRLGFWQWHRLEHRLDRNVVIERHLRADAVPLDAALPTGTRVTQDEEWTRVTATGRFDTDRTLTVKFAVRDGAPGVDVVTPLVLADGSALWVDRGWVQTDNTAQRPTDLPDPGSGDVTVTGWLRPDNGAGPEATEPVDGQVRAVSSAALADEAGRPVRGGYLDLLQQSPAGTSADLTPEPVPELGQGPHFFYALQWWFFALLAIVGYGWFARIERKERTESGPDDDRPDVPRPRKPVKVRQSNHPSARVPADTTAVRPG